MSSKLTFKKAFGIESLPVDAHLWLMELESGEYELTIGEALVRIGIGRFGTTDQEKFAISLFRHADDRALDFIHEIPTIDVSLYVDIDIPESLLDKWQENSIANGVAGPFIDVAFKALSRFIDGYRDVKYLAQRDSAKWRKQETLLIPPLTERQFTTYLFYVLETGGRTFVGSFSNGRIIVSTPLDANGKEKLQETIQGEPPLDRKLIVRAWEYFFEEDFRSAVIYSATVIELSVARAIRKNFTLRSVGSSSQIDKFIEETSNRLLCTVILGVLGIGEHLLRDGLADIFEIRNGLIHGRRRSVSREDAEAALDRTEKLLTLLA